MRELLMHEKMLVVTFIIFMAVLVVAFAIRYRKINGPGSAIFATANAGSNFAKKIEYHVDKGIKILMPLGKGSYPLDLKKNKRACWEECFFSWAERDVGVTAILCDPKVDALKYWNSLSDRIGDTFSLIVLRKELLNSQDVVEFQRLIKFHPVLVSQKENPFCMWIEKHHPTGSSRAYNVEYVAPEDMNEFQIKKFQQYQNVISKLIAKYGNKTQNSENAA